MKKVAFILRGAVSKKNGKLVDNLYNEYDYVNIDCVANSIHKHIISPNKNFSFDFFLHSWAFDLETKLNELYNPVKSVYEKNHDYFDIIIDKLNRCPNQKNNVNSFGQISQALSIKKSCLLVKNYIENQKVNYDYVVLYRPDVLIWKNLYLEEYPKEFVNVNSFGQMEGDFHFVFTPEKLDGFISIFDEISSNYPPIPHFLIKTHLTKNCGFSLKNDEIIAGKDQEVVRKLKNLPNIDMFSSYGISKDEILSYEI